MATKVKVMSSGLMRRLGVRGTAMIDSFQGEYRFLSNFYPAKVEFEGLIYPSAEHAYQSAKTLDMKIRQIFTLEGMTAGQAKHLGRVIKCRSDWESDKERVMLACLISKFSNAALSELLLATCSSPLVEGNTWGDHYWGVYRGKGLNRLGELLMQVRSTLG